MSEIFTVPLLRMIEKLGESKTKEILSSFSCPKNKDVEYFLKETAIIFSNQGLARTHLIFATIENKPVLIGYFALAPKYITIKKASLSNRLQDKIKKFAIYDSVSKEYRTSASLIGQLGKNFTNGYDKLIKGDDLLKLALQKIHLVQQEIGGKITYLECEDKPYLIEFYERNGFITFGKRTLDKDESDNHTGRYLIQMLRYGN